MDMTEIWKKTLESVKSSVSSIVGYNVHIKSSVPISFSDSVFTISVPLSINKNMIEFRYRDEIETALEKTTGIKFTLNVLVDGEEIEKKLPVSDTVNPKYTFENFVIGAGNDYAAGAAISTTENPGRIYNPLFLYGNSGLGKTHLMQAIGNRIIQTHPELKVIYVSSEHFTNEFIKALKDGKLIEFKRTYRMTDVLLIDDIQFL